MGPDIPKHLHKPGDIVADVGAIIKGSIPDSQILFGNNTAIADMPDTNPDNNIIAADDNYEDSPDFFDDFSDNATEIVAQDNSNSNAGTATANNDDGDFDIYNDSSYHDYNLINDVPNHTIGGVYDSINMHIDDDDIICRKIL